MILDLLPGCMLPDGAEPCRAYSELYEKALRMEAVINRISSIEDDYNSRDVETADNTSYYLERVFDLCRFQ